MKSPSSYKFNISEKNIQIVDSYKVKDEREMKVILNYLRAKRKCKKDVLEQRSEKSLITEWRAHNFLYFFHIFRNGTNNVDLDTYKSNKTYMIFYHIMSFCYTFIKPFYNCK